MSADTELDELTSYVTRMWPHFLNTVRLQHDVDLADKIWLFSTPIANGLATVNNTGEIIVASNPIMFWQLLWLGIKGANTHTAEELNSAFKLVHDRHFKKTGFSALARKLTKVLDSPIKRAGLVVLALGACMLVGGVLVIGADSSSHVLDRLWKAALRDRYFYHQYWVAAWGVYLTIAGLLFSLLYDATLGRVVRWIRLGAAGAP